MTTVVRELDGCVFCGGAEMTEEHLLADWAYRAFSKSRKSRGLFSGQFVGPGRMRIDPTGDPVPLQE